MSIPFEKSFASNEKAKFWDKEKNIVEPKDILNNKSGKKYWFKCNECNHSFKISLENINKGCWCPYCCKPQQKLCDNEECKSCFKKSFASHSKVLYWSDKNKLNPREVFKNSDSIKYIFYCDICNHDFERLPYNIQDLDITHCIYCAIPTKILCNNDECVFCFNRSFASHEKSKYYSSKNKLNPRQIIKGNNSKFIFNCNNCNHEFEKSLSKITIEDGWCPYCSNPPKQLCNNKECKICFDKSFASHPKVVYWSNKNKLNPREVFKLGDTRIYFDCICGHTFDSQIKNITKDGWCPYCSNPPKRLCDNEECTICFEKSFASNPKSIHWSDKNKLKPIQVFKNSNSKFWFECIKHHIFNSSLGHINGRNSWCPHCQNKTEQKLYEQLLHYYNSLTKQFKQEWCKKITYLPFDFCIPEYKIIIELDGKQHFQQVSNWSSPEEQFENDKYKETCANEQGYIIIRLLQEDVFDDTYEWLETLLMCIEEIISGNRKNYYLCENNEYDGY